MLPSLQDFKILMLTKLEKSRDKITTDILNLIEPLPAFNINGDKDLDNFTIFEFDKLAMALSLLEPLPLFNINDDEDDDNFTAQKLRALNEINLLYARPAIEQLINNQVDFQKTMDLLEKHWQNIQNNPKFLKALWNILEGNKSGHFYSDVFSLLKTSLTQNNIAPNFISKLLRL